MCRGFKKENQQYESYSIPFWFQTVAFVLIVYGGYASLDLGDKLPTFACVFNSEGTGGKCYIGMLQHDLKEPI